MLRHILFIASISTGIGLVGSSETYAGNYTTYVINMAQLHYKTPVYYNTVFRSGNSADVFTSSSACLQNIKQRVAQNKRNGWDYECFLIVYTDSYPFNPNNGTSTLANVSSGAYGKWAGWIIYWTPALGKGSYLTPYSQFKTYGPSAQPAVNVTPAALNAPSGKASTTPSSALNVSRNSQVSPFQTGHRIHSGGAPSLGRPIILGQTVDRFPMLKHSFTCAAIAVNDDRLARNGDVSQGEGIRLVQPSSLRNHSKARLDGFLFDS